MKKFSSFSENVISKNEMKKISGGMLLNCTCTSGNNNGATFTYSTAGSNDGMQNEYRSAVCNTGTSSCVGTVVMIP